MAAVIQQLKNERDRAAKTVARLDAALAALNAGGRSGGSRTLSADARERIAAAQRARWARVKGNREEGISGAEGAGFIGRGAQENRGSAASQVGKGQGGEEDCLRLKRDRRAISRGHRRHFHVSQRRRRCITTIDRLIVFPTMLRSPASRRFQKG